MGKAEQTLQNEDNHENNNVNVKIYLNFICLASLTDQEINVLHFVYGWVVCVYMVLNINYGVLCTQIICLFLNYHVNRNADKFICDVSRIQILILVLEFLLYDRNNKRYFPIWHSWPLDRPMNTEKLSVGNVVETKNDSFFIWLTIHVSRRSIQCFWCQNICNSFQKFQFGNAGEKKTETKSNKQVNISVNKR